MTISFETTFVNQILHAVNINDTDDKVDVNGKRIYYLIETFITYILQIHATVLHYTFMLSIGYCNLQICKQLVELL